jgi:hypothetical protein
MPIYKTLSFALIALSFGACAAHSVARNATPSRSVDMSASALDDIDVPGRSLNVAVRLVTTISKSRRRRSCKTSASSPTVSISQFCNEGASHNHDSSLVSSQMTNILGMTPSQQMSVIQKTVRRRAPI